MQTTQRTLHAVILAATFIFVAVLAGGLGENGPENAMGFVLDILALVATMFALCSLAGRCWSSFTRRFEQDM